MKFARKDRPINVATPVTSSATAISEAERARRLSEVNFARGSVRYEGGILSDEIEQLNARYVAGEITSDELTAAILLSDTVRSA
nr:antitoxin VbhA family protein [Sphingomonas sp. CROZ-RG-20F-R02-07]